MYYVVFADFAEETDLVFQASWDGREAVGFVWRRAIGVTVSTQRDHQMTINRNWLYMDHSISEWWLTKWDCFSFMFIEYYYIFF